MSFDPLEPYGPLLETTVRLATWNVWANFGPWEDRFRVITAELARVDADIICLAEVWKSSDVDIVGRMAAELGYEAASALAWFEPMALHSGTAILSRWPITIRADTRLEGFDGGDGAAFQYAQVDGPRGPIDVFAVMLDWRPDLSHVRQQQVRDLASFVATRGSIGRVGVICGDFNAAPETDEMRMITGQAPPAAPGFHYYDAWAMAGDSTPGWTWDNSNGWASIALMPNRRIDYVLTAWPRAAGAGHPVRCELIGTPTTISASNAGDLPPSDHYGVAADLRY